MPYLAYSELSATTNQFPSDGGAGSLANSATRSVCAALGALGNYVRAATSAAGFPSAVSSFVSGRGVFDRLCQPYPSTEPIPPMPRVTEPPNNCITQGTILWRRALNWGQPSQSWLDQTETWTCTSGRGVPISGPKWFPRNVNTPGYYEILFWNSNKTAVISRKFSASGASNPPESVQITSINWSYCPVCNLPPWPVPIPIPPPQEDDEEPIPVPEITIDIDFPRGWGLPPLVVPVVFSPIIVAPGAVSVQPTLTLAPRIDINPDFAFAPTIEFNLGGISIGGGGYPEPEQDVEDICSCECPTPEPCEVDYARIQRIATAVASTFREIPGYPAAATSVGPWVEGAGVELEIGPGGRWLEFEFNLDSYRGGLTSGVGPNPAIYYPGWLTFGMDAIALKGSSRLFLNHQSGFIPIPPYAKVCYIQSQDGAIAKARVVSVLALPDVE